MKITREEEQERVRKGARPDAMSHGRDAICFRALPARLSSLRR